MISTSNLYKKMTNSHKKTITHNLLYETLMVDKISQFIVRQKFFVIFISLIIVFLAASGLPKTKFSSDYRIFFSDDNENLKAFEDLQATFTRSDNVMFVLSPKDGHIFTQSNLAIIEELTDCLLYTSPSPRD